MKRLMPLLMILVAVVAADQVTKHWVASRLRHACFPLGPVHSGAPRLETCRAEGPVVKLASVATALRLRDLGRVVDWSLTCEGKRPCLSGTVVLGREIRGTRSRGKPPILTRGGIYTLEVAGNPPTRLGFTYERPAPAYPVIAGFFDLEYAENPGAAFSFLARSPGVRRPLLIGITVLAFLFIGWLAWRARPDQRLYSVGLALLMAGALGNLIDRIHLGYVIDFLLLHVRDSFRWPNFNVADMAIVVGVLLLLVDALRGWLRERRKRRQSAEAS